MSSSILKRYFEGEKIPHGATFVKSERLSFYDEEGDALCDCPLSCDCASVYKTVFYFLIPQGGRDE